MKKIFLVAFIATVAMHGYMFAMENNQKKEEQMIGRVKQMSGIGAIVGGWGFFAANSQSLVNKLPYAAKRAPLALFLASCTINQAFIIAENQPNFDVYKKIDVMHKKYMQEE